MADFYFSDDGEHLLGSYLHGIEEVIWDMRSEVPTPRQSATCRFGIFLQEWQLPRAFYTPWGTFKVAWRLVSYRLI